MVSRMNLTRLSTSGLTWCVVGFLVLGGLK
jgi:hypothetical protein